MFVIIGALVKDEALAMRAMDEVMEAYEALPLSLFSLDASGFSGSFGHVVVLDVRIIVPRVFLPLGVLSLVLFAWLHWGWLLIAAVVWALGDVAFTPFMFRLGLQRKLRKAGCASVRMLGTRQIVERIMSDGTIRDYGLAYGEA